MPMKYTTVQHYWVDGDGADIDAWEAQRKPGEMWYRADKKELCLKDGEDRVVITKKQV